MSKAMIASEVAATGSAVLLPVVTYTRCFFTSTVGDDQMPAPAGPHSCTPLLFLRVGLSSPVMVLLFHSTSPVAASSAARVPRSLQHSYRGSAPAASSTAVIGTYSTPPDNVGAPVIVTMGCSSSSVFHTPLPVTALTAWARVRWSPKYSVLVFSSTIDLSKIEAGRMELELT